MCFQRAVSHAYADLFGVSVGGDMQTGSWFHVVPSSDVNPSGWLTNWSTGIPPRDTWNDKNLEKQRQTKTQIDLHNKILISYWQ